MADKPIKTPGSITQQADIKNNPIKTKTSGSITQKADNSNERISEISNINRTISNMQKKVDQQLGEMSKDVGNTEAISSVQNSMNKVLQKLSTTVGDIGKGFGKVSVDVAKSSKDVITQYGQAISQDINVNKQNIVAMALSKSTPIYGYFISKFMETDVWKSASARMKENIGNTLSSVGQKLKNVIGDLKTSKTSKKDTDSLSKQTRSIKVPHMAKGGVVEKAGLAKLHAAEVVMPVDKLLSRIDDQVTTTRLMAKNVEQGQLHSMAKMNTYVGSLEQFQKRGLIKGFFTALKDVQTQYEEPSSRRMLRAVLSIQDVLGAQIGKWSQVWQNMLIQNPVFRNAMLMGNLLRKTLAAPFAPVYSIFKQRGGYRGHLSKSKSPLEALNENIGSLYTGTMYRLDGIATYTKATAEATRDISSAIIGKTYDKLPGIKTGKWSIFGMARKFLNTATNFIVKSIGNVISIQLKHSHFRKQFDDIAEALTKERKLGISTKSGFKKYLSELYGEGKENPEEEKLKQKKIKSKDEGQYSPYWAGLSKSFNKKDKSLRITDTNQKEIDNTSKKLLQITDKNYQQDAKEFKVSKKALKYAESNLKENKQANERSRRQSIFGFLSGGFGAVKGLLTNVMGFIGPLLTGGLSGLLGGGLGGLLGGGSGGVLKKITGFIASKPFALALGGALGVAFAGTAGWALGKKLDEVLGITDAINNWYSWNEKQGREVRKTLGTGIQDSQKERLHGGEQGYKDQKRLSLPSLMNKEAARRKKDVGWLGRFNFDQISDAQYLYQRNNINKYMPYSAVEQSAIRSQWLDEGGFRGGKFKEDIKEYGERRESAFLKYLMVHGKPMSNNEMIEDQNKYQKQISARPDYKGESIDSPYTTKDGITHMPIPKEVDTTFKKVQDLAKEKLTEAKKTITETIKVGKDHAVRLKKEAGIASATITETAKEQAIKAKKIATETIKTGKDYAVKLKKEAGIASATITETAKEQAIKAKKTATETVKAGKDHMAGLKRDMSTVSGTAIDLAKKQTNETKKSAMDKMPTIKDSMVALYSRKHDLVKQQVTETVLSTQALAEVMKTTTVNAIKASKEAAGKVGDAINQNTVVVSNTISNASSTVTNGAKSFATNIEDQYNQYLIRGDVDGD